MSNRSNYSEELDQWDHIRWRGAVKSAIRGKRGQAALRELLEALDAMPDKALIANSLVTTDGDCCALGALGIKRGLDMSGFDPDEYDVISDAFGLAPALIREIEYENDEGEWRETPEQRWYRMRRWAAKQIKPEPKP